MGGGVWEVGMGDGGDVWVEGMGDGRRETVSSLVQYNTPLQPQTTYMHPCMHPSTPIRRTGQDGLSSNGPSVVRIRVVLYTRLAGKEGGV